MIAALAVALLAAGAPPKTVRWERTLEEALRQARASNRPIMVDFWAEWCEWCHRLDQTTYVDPTVRGLLHGFVTVKIDTEGSAAGAATAAQFDVDSLPTIVFLSSRGRVLFKVTGFQGPGQFPDTLHEAQEVGERVMGWESALSKNPDDPVALASLGLHLYDQELLDESRPLLERARLHDDQRPPRERKRTRNVLGVLAILEQKFPEAETVLREALSLPPVEDYDAKTLFILGRVYLKWGRPDDARACLKSIVDSHASSAVAPKAREMLVALDRKTP
jgi:thiol-disulfide isomerase/thioredoxin